MIATLRGRLQARDDDGIILNVGGIGFRVRVSSRTLANLGAVGGEVELFTHLRVREDELTLYGFENRDDLRLFETLLTVSGVGPKVALGVLSAAPSETLRLAIAQGNVDVLTGIPGIGSERQGRCERTGRGRRADPGG